jgi:hypothetical protein
LLGYRHARNTSTGHQGQLSFTVIPQITYTVSVRTCCGNYYIQAVNGGGSSVNATAPEPSTWETFTIVDTNGGALVSGDSVNVRALSGHYLVAEGGGGPGSVVNADRIVPGAWETFTIEKKNGTGIISTTDQIALRSYNGYYVGADGGGGGAVKCDAGSAQAWETFTLGPKG